MKGEEIREMILQDFGLDLPISGGSGTSLENPLVISKAPDGAASIEHAFLKCIGLGRRIEWKMVRQALIAHHDRKIDKVTIETKQLTPTEVITQVENYYFDVSAYFSA